MVPQVYGKYYISLTVTSTPLTLTGKSPGQAGVVAVPRSAGWPTLPALLVLGLFSWFFETLSRQSPGPARVGAVPGALALTMLTWGRGARASGRAEVRPHARGSPLDVHTELPIVCVRGSVSTYIQNWQLVVYVGASRRTYRIGNCLCTWERLDVHTELAIVCVRGSPFGVRSSWCIRSPCCFWGSSQQCFWVSPTLFCIKALS